MNSVADDPEKKPRSIVDVGCGIGGSSRYLAKKYGAECHGITLSPVQAERAQALAADQGLADKVRQFVVSVRFLGKISKIFLSLVCELIGFGNEILLHNLNFF